MSTSDAQQLAMQNTYSDKAYCALLNEAVKGLADVAAGRSSNARASILAIQERRSASRFFNLVAKINQLS